MRKVILLLLVILVIAAVDARRRLKTKTFSKTSGGRIGYRIGIRFPKKKFSTKHKSSKSYSHQYTHTQTKKVDHKLSFNYNINIKHNYKSEVHCSKHCVPDKAYWQGDHCLCHEGLAGAGDLCCTDPKEYKYTCTVRGDPYVHSYLGQKATIFNPCGQVLAVINAKTTSGQSCHVTVRSADVIEQGIFITNQVEISYAIDGKEREFVVLDGERFYSSLKNSWEELGTDCSKCFSIHEERVQVLEDKHRRVWTISGCGTTVNLRRDTRGGRPGVCISSKDEYSQRPYDKPDDSVCNKLTHDTDPYHSKATYYLAKSFERKEYKNLKLNCAYGGLCKTITTTFNECSESRRAKALNACSAILEHDFRSCVFMRDGLDGAKLFKLFSQCLTAYCDGDQQWCYTQKSEETFLHCTLPKMHCCDFQLHGAEQQKAS